MFAVIETGGKQYIVKTGEIITIEKLEGAAGSAVSFDKVLMVGNEDGSVAKIGTPFVSGAVVSGTIKEQGRADKIRVVKFKAKVRYTRRAGHRQMYTKVAIEKVG